MRLITNISGCARVVEGKEAVLEKLKHSGAGSSTCTHITKSLQLNAARCKPRKAPGDGSRNKVSRGEIAETIAANLKAIPSI